MMMKTVLVIENNVLHMKLFCDFLKMKGYMPLRAFNGRVGLSMASQHQIDLIVLDIDLPDLTDLDVLSKLRADENLRDIPVIAVTAPGDEWKVDEYLDRDFDAYAAKPVSMADFINTVGDLIGFDRAPVAGAA